MDMENDLNIGALVDEVVEARSAPSTPPAPEPAPTPSPAPEPSPAPAAGPAPAPASPPPAPKPDGYPKTWKPEHSAKWDSVDPDVRAEILRREEDFFRGTEQYKNDALFARAIQSQIAEFMPVMRQYGIDPVQQVAGLMRAHHTLALGTPEQKAALIKGIFADYRIDPKSVFGEGGEGGEPRFVDPDIAELHKRLESMEVDRQRQTAAAVEAKRGELRSQIEAFAGDPANKYFEDVAPQIATLIRANSQMTLKDAYEAACWTNPAVRAKMMAEQQAADAESARKAQEAHAAQAAAASAANLKAPARPASATAAQDEDMDATLKNTLAEIRSR